MDIGPAEIVIVLLVIVLLFGGAKLPKLARSLGSAKGEFEKGLKEGEKASKEADAKPAEPTETKVVENKVVEAKTVEPTPAPEPASVPEPVEAKPETTA
jgi:sec-independent protein translocase protein TatA